MFHRVLDRTIRPRRLAQAALAFFALLLSVSQSGCTGILNNDPDLRW